MQTRIQKWGNSLALRIPKALALEAHIDTDALVELVLVEGQLVIRPITEPQLTLDELLSRVTEDNVHHEINTGTPVGKEAW
jgi:antitoxin MazE